MTVDVLDREMYSEAEAARLLGVSQSALNYWLEGGVRRGRTYAPVIRESPRGHRAAVTWAEFIEAGLLRGYRRDARVPMRELRTFIDVLRERLGVPYPLAGRRPFAVGRQLLMEAQEASQLGPDFWLVSDVRGQLSLLPAADAFFRRVVWEHDVAAGWRVAADAESPVVVTPERRFGRPSIAGVSTEVIWEHHEADEGDDEIADAFGLSAADIDWALSYERAARARRAA